MKPRLQFLIAVYVLPLLFWGTLIAVALEIRPAHAAPAQLAADVQAWGVANNDCRGAPERNPACKRRDKIAQGLVRQGAIPAPHEMWVLPDELDAFAVIMERCQVQAETSPLSFYDGLITSVMMELRAKLSDRTLFAIWNADERLIAKTWPMAYALALMGMRQLDRNYSRNNDVTLQLDRK